MIDEYLLTCPVGTPRNPKWGALARRLIEAHPYCSACGCKGCLEVHHVFPIHDWPEFELDESRLAVMCRVCHYLLGHCCDWKARNAWVKPDAARMLRRVKDRRYGKDDRPQSALVEA